MELKDKELRLHLLGLISVKSAFGYNLAKIMKRSYIWRSTHQQIYRTLSDLHDAKYLSCQLVPQAGKPDRKQYSITPAGTKALETALIDMSPKISSEHNIHTIMLQLRNLEYFEQLAEKLELAIDATAVELKRATCPYEKLAMKRENFIRHGELEFCAEAINLITEINAQQAAA